MVQQQAADVGTGRAHAGASGHEEEGGGGFARTLHVRGEVLGELLELGQVLAEVELRPVEEDSEDGLGGAGVVDDLRAGRGVGWMEVGIERGREERGEEGEPRPEAARGGEGGRAWLAKKTVLP